MLCCKPPDARDKGFPYCPAAAAGGGGGYSQALFDAVNAHRSAGVLFIAAAGNEAANNDAVASYPANYFLDNVISVGSITSTGTISSFSNYGATTVDLFAPGSSIVSTWPVSTYATLSGTSKCPVGGSLLLNGVASDRAGCLIGVQRGEEGGRYAHMFECCEGSPKRWA